MCLKFVWIKVNYVIVSTSGLTLLIPSAVWTNLVTIVSLLKINLLFHIREMVNWINVFIMLNKKKRLFVVLVILFPKLRLLFILLPLMSSFLLLIFYKSLIFPSLRIEKKLLKLSALNLIYLLTNTVNMSL